MIYVLDFGSQYTQLIAKRLRGLGYSSEVVSGRNSAKSLFEMAAKSGNKISGIILSGSPASVGSVVLPDTALFEAGVPMLGICFGYQFMASHFGGVVEKQLHREYGRAEVVKTAEGQKDPLTKNLSASSVVWMSHGDSVTKIPSNAVQILESRGQTAAFSIPSKKLWALQFHPEVHHSPEGDRILESFARDICGVKGDWKMDAVLGNLRAELKKQLAGVKEVTVAVSGGVDSTVMAVLLSEFVTVRALFVDHGFLRDYDLSDLKKVFKVHPTIHLEVVDARKEFWAELDGVSDPEKKRKIIGKLFIDTFYGHVVPQGHEPKEGEKLYLAQGTIYSDVIESAANDLAPAEKIKSHHNVGGLPENIKFELVEPLRKFFKDEVRTIGALLGIAPESLARHPFPGPGLAIRCIGALSPEKIDIIRQSDAILHEELMKRDLYKKTWQALTVLLPVSTVGVMGDGRSYESVVGIRAVSSVDAMTAEASELPWSDLKAISSRIVNEVRGVNRVVFDLTSKPPGTIEWE